MKPHESARINKKSIRGDLGDSWPAWNRGISFKSTDHKVHDRGKRLLISNRCQKECDESKFVISYRMVHNWIKNTMLFEG